MTNLDQLLQELCPDGVKFRELQEILKIKNGGDYKKFKQGNVPVYGSGGIMTYVDTAAYDKPSVLIPRKGSLDKLYYVTEPFWNVDTVFYTEIDESYALPRYVYHCLKREHLEQYNMAVARYLTISRSLRRSLRRGRSSMSIIVTSCFPLIVHNLLM